MKNWKKAVLLPLLVLLAGTALLSGCAKTSAEEEAENVEIINEESVSAVESFTENIFIGQIFTLPYETYQLAIDMGQTVFSPAFDVALAKRWETFTEKHGAITGAEILDTTKTSDNGYTSRMILTGADDAQMAMTITYNDACQPVKCTLEEYSDDSTVALGKRMASAGGNIVVGLGIVFGVLVLLSLVIAALGLVGKAGKKTEAPKAQEASAPAAAPAPVKAAPANPADDSQLVAVIAAAIAASENVPVDGLVVRSIRRLNTNKWR